MEFVADGCCGVISIDGEVDLSTVDRLGEVVKEAGNSRAVEHLVFECRGIEFLDSSGLKQFIEASAAYENRVALVAPPRIVVRLLEATGLGEFFQIAATTSEAQRHLHGATS